MKTLIKSALAGSAVVAAAVMTAAPSDAAGPLQVHATSVVQFQQVQGQAQWAARERNRVANARWRLEDNGTFTFTTVDVRTDVFPLRGTYRIDGKHVSFSAHGSAAIGGSSTFTELVGTMDFASNPPTATFQLANGAGYGAVVNNQRFGTTASSQYGGTVTLATG